MTTSGTIGQTTIDTAVVVERALNRCGVAPAKQTPEMVDTAMTNLYLLLLQLSARGLNLWCVEKALLGLAVGRATYALPVGTLDLLNLNFCYPTLVEATNSAGANSMTATATADVEVCRFGFKLTGAATGTILFEYWDGAAWQSALSVASAAMAAGTWYWFDIDPKVTADQFRVTCGVTATFDDFVLSSRNTEIPLYQWNRDDYSMTPDRSRSGRPSTNYFFEKKITPQISLWPVPTTETDHLALWRHRQIQDIGTLTQTLELPARWFNAVIWQLAKLLVFEVPGVSPERARLVIESAPEALIETEADETDGAPIYLAPRIRGYTR